MTGHKTGPQGVAQRLIDEYAERYRNSQGNYAHMRDSAMALEALNRLEFELSAEARRVLAEEGFERRPQIVSVLREAFERLGLNLEDVNE